jgi:hypothetical protein
VSAGRIATALHVIGYPTAIAVLTRFVPVVRDRRLRWFVAHQAGVAAIVGGWLVRGNTPAAVVNGSWLVSATAWYVLAGRRGRGRRA